MQRVGRSDGRLAPRQATRRSGFTLIEMLAVVLIFALVAGVALPNFRLRTGQTTLGEAKQLAASLEFARQRAVMTRIVHRVVLDLDRAAYWIEWDAPPPDAEETPHWTEVSWSQVEELPRVAPRGPTGEFRPVPSPLGRPTRLVEEVLLAYVDTDSDRVETGRVAVTFAQDGGAESTEVLIVDTDQNQILLTVSPLAERIRVERVAQ